MPMTTCLRAIRLTALGALLPLLAGCTIGPDFQASTALLPASWEQHEPGPPGAGRVNAAVDQQWWRSFDDPLLSSLVQRMALANLDLQMAASRLTQSRAARGDIVAARWPTVTAQGAASHARSSANGLLDASSRNGQADYNLWQTGVDASWELDLWGRVQRQAEAADARIEASQEDAHAVLVALAAETARDYIQLRGSQNALRITQQNLALAQRLLALTNVRFHEGVATTLEVAEAAARVAEIEARIPNLQQRVAELINALSLLLTQAPQSLQAELVVASTAEHEQAIRIPAALTRIALGLPSDLAQRRPDIRRAEAALHAATADIGVAQGSFYPRITLSGSFGLQALQLADLGSWGSHGFALGPGISLPLFDGGRLRATVQLKQAQQQEAALQYRKTVLMAWHEVDDAITACHSNGERRDHLAEAVEQSRRAWSSAQQQYQQGSTDFLQVLSVQNTLLNNEIAWSASRVSAALAQVALYTALGGGWESSTTVNPRLAQPRLHADDNERSTQ